MFSSFSIFILIRKIFHRKKGMLLRDFQCSGQESWLSECEVQEMKSYKKCKSSKAAYVNCNRGTFVIDSPNYPGQTENGHPRESANRVCMTWLKPELWSRDYSVNELRVSVIDVYLTNTAVFKGILSE